MTGPGTPLDVRSSRVLSIPVAAAIGATLSLSATVLVLLGPLVGVAGRAAPSAYLLSLVFFLPVILSLVESAYVPGEPGGLFHLARVRSRLQSSFLIGWLLLGGLALLGAGLTLGAAGYLTRLGQIFFAADLGGVGPGLALLALVTLNQWPRSAASWPRRAAVFFGGLVALAGLLGWARWAAPEPLQVYAFLPSRDPIDGLQFLVVGLWGLHFTLEHQRFIRGGVFHGLGALAGGVLISAVAGWAVASSLLNFPVLFQQQEPPLAGLAAAAGPIWEVATLAVIVVLIGSALDLVVASGLRLIAEMSEARYLPAGGSASIPGRTAGRPLLILAGAVAAASVLLPLPQAFAGSAAAITGALATLLLPHSLRRSEERRRDRPFLLPLYPLFPAASAVICVVILLGLPPASLVLMVGWLALGGIYFLARARRAAIDWRQQQEVVSDRLSPTKPAEYRVLVGVANPATAVGLLRAGGAVARARGGDLLALRIIESAEQMPAVERHRQARLAWEEMRGWLSEAGLDSFASFRPLVRFAPTIREGLSSTLWEESIDTLILGWPSREGPRQIRMEDTIDLMVRMASCEVLILRGEMPAVASSILVPMTSDAHARAALTLARDLAPEKIVALRPVQEHLTPARRNLLTTDLQEIFQRQELPDQTEARILQTSETPRAIAEVAADFDLTILGVSDEGFLSPTAVLGLPQAVAEGTHRPLLLIKRREIVHQFWLRRAWEQLYSSLPTLSGDQQTAVGLGMRAGARAGIDFYMMILLSSLLAVLGLLQDSAAVIIGAMLVAPLMSPILGMAHGVVRGDNRIVRQAANSTLNGVVLAIALPAALTLFLPDLGFSARPTAEILARTQPTLLDLLVAFLSGLAAAYAISRDDVAAALPGVAIAAALVPPLAVVGYGVGTAQFAYASGALLLFLTNLAAIVLAGTVMFLLLGIRPPPRVERGERVREALRWIGVAIVVVSIPLALSSAGASRRIGIQERTAEFIAGRWHPSHVSVVEVKVEPEGETTTVHLTVYDHRASLTLDDMRRLADDLAVALDLPVRLEYVIIPVEAGQVRAATTTPTPRPSPTISPTPRPTRTPSPAPTP